MFQSIYTATISHIQKSLGKGSGWIIDSFIDQTISNSKYNLLAGRSNMKLPKELDYPRKRLIKIQSISRYCLQAFSTEEILKRHIKDCFEINGKQRIKMPRKGEHVKFKNYERKIKSRFIIYADFESILVSEDNGKPDPEESYKNKYQKHITFSYGYKLVCVDDKFSKPFKTYSGEDVVYNFIKSMIE